MVKQKKRSKMKEIFLSYIRNHMKDFFIITIVFLIGLVFGVIFINYMNEQQEQETVSYIKDFIQQLQQEDRSIDKALLVKQSIRNNLIMTGIFWIAGCTVIGIPILYGFVGFRGFCLGYTISSVFASLSLNNAFAFSITTLLLQNILLIPAMLAISVSGVQLYRSIMKDKANIKMEIYRHTIFSCMIGIVMIGSSLIEGYVSTNLFMMAVKHIALS